MIPAYLNVFNTLTWPVKMADECARLGLEPIFYDHASTYPPLLDYYRTTPYQVIRARGNGGCHGFFRNYRTAPGYYVHSDGDLDLSSVPDDVVTKLIESFEANPQVTKVGLSLEIDDLPDHYPHKTAVTTHEQQYWRTKTTQGPAGFVGSIDTTFALYNTDRGIGDLYAAVRLDRPYTARHLTWYLDPENIPDDVQFYLKTMHQSTSWSEQLRKHIEK